MDITTATPAEIDTEIHRLGAERTRHGMYLTSLRRDLGESENQDAGYGTRRHIRRTTPELRAAIARTERQIADLIEAELVLAGEFARRGGWTRWYLVPDGHLHYDVSGDRCSRIPTTDHYWMTEFSGESAEKIIALAGDRVCTSCFPEAPVAPRPATVRFMTPSEAERAAYREAAENTRTAKKAAQVKTPEGEELRVPNGCGGLDLVKTETAAWRRAMQGTGDLAFYGGGHPSAGEWRETVDRCVAALAHRRGTPESVLREELNTRVAKKAKREEWSVLATV